MKNLQISDNDLLGNRFNGHDLHFQLMQRGIDAKQLVWTKRSDDPHTFELADNFVDKRKINHKMIQRIEEELGVQSFLFPFGYALLFQPHFLDADVVHYHLMQNTFFNLALLPIVSRLKPSVWTLHDPWAMTGHCVHPFECDRWKTGCGDCPQLEIEAPLKHDVTALNWELKRLNYHNSDIDIIVASKWMLNMAQQSPLLSRFRLHQIPFGVDLETFRPMDAAEAKAKLGIAPGSLVICFRLSTWKLKGLDFIKTLLHSLPPEQPMCLLGFGARTSGLLKEFQGKYQVIESGWVHDERQLATIYNAADVVLTPSLAEGFGMMAIEAMACGKPVVAFEGTALAEVLCAPEGGVVAPMNDGAAFVRAAGQMIASPDMRRSIGENALRIARQQYSVKNFVDKIIAVYQEVIERRSSDVARYAAMIAQLKQIALARQVTIAPENYTLKKIIGHFVKQAKKRYRKSSV